VVTDLLKIFISCKLIFVACAHLTKMLFFIDQFSLTLSFQILNYILLLGNFGKIKIL
jgi:hypothetical protein